VDRHPRRTRATRYGAAGDLNYGWSAFTTDISPDQGKRYSRERYSLCMFDRSEVLREVMRETGTTQTELARLSGVHQPSISQFLSTKVDLSDEQLDRLLSCMGYRLEVNRRAFAPGLTRAERRSWKLHRQLSTQLTRSTLTQWRPTMLANLERLRAGVRGQPHIRNLDRWEALVKDGDVAGLHRVLTGLDRDHIEMREVTPMSGLLSDEERTKVLQDVD
jgi:transcriptional regulator with XRE-family HTH domain